MNAPPTKSSKNPAVVVGLDTLPGLQTARILAHHDIPVIAIARNRDHHCCRTNVVQELHFGDTKSTEFLDVLQKIAGSADQKPVLFPCLDPAVLTISAHRDELAKDFHIALPPAETVDLLSNKTRFYAHAQQHGLPIPKTCFLHDRDDAVAVKNELEFPVVLKPSVRLATWDANTKYKAFKIETPEELVSMYVRCREWTDVLIVQEWIEGGDNSLYSCNCYFDAQNRPLVTFVARKLRQWPPGIGFSSLGEEVRNDFVEKETVRLFESVSYHGLGYVEFKQDSRTGKTCIIEPNVGRPTGRSAIAEAGGVDLLYTMYCDVLGMPLPENRTQSYSGAKWIDLRHDFQSALYYWRRGELTLGEWRQSWKGKKAYAYYASDDLAPFLFDLYRAIGSSIGRRKR